MVLFIIILIAFLFLLGLLVIPIKLTIKTESEIYKVGMPFYFSAQIVPEKVLFSVVIRIFMIPIKIDPFKSQEKEKREREKKKTNSLNIGKMTSSIKYKKLLNAITIRRAYAEIDTGDFPLNAQLIPVAHYLNRGNVQLHVNFEDRNIFDIEIFTKLYKIVWVAITNKLITSKK